VRFQMISLRKFAAQEEFGKPASAVEIGEVRLGEEPEGALGMCNGSA